MAAAGEMLICEREPRNIHDRYAVTVKIWNGHWTLSRRLARVCLLFLR